MAWIVDVEVVSADEAEYPDAYEVVFDVIYPGETWARSLVRVAPSALPPSSTGAAHPELERRTAGSDVVSRARDALLAELEVSPAPVSLDLRMTDRGTEVLASSRLDPR